MQNEIRFTCMISEYYSNIYYVIILDNEGKIISLEQKDDFGGYISYETMKITKKEMITTTYTDTHSKLGPQFEKQFKKPLSDSEFKKEVRAFLRIFIKYDIENFKLLSEVIKEDKFKKIAEELRKEALAEMVAKYDF